MLAENASWLFRSGPYLIFSATWVAAALVPTFATSLKFSWAADLIRTKVLLPSWLVVFTLGLTLVMALVSGVAALRSLRQIEPATLLR